MAECGTFHCASLIRGVHKAFFGIRDSIRSLCVNKNRDVDKFINPILPCGTRFKMSEDVVRTHTKTGFAIFSGTLSIIAIRN